MTAITIIKLRVKGNTPNGNNRNGYLVIVDGAVDGAVLDGGIGHAAWSKLWPDGVEREEVITTSAEVKRLVKAYAAATAIRRIWAS